MIKLTEGKLNLLLDGQFGSTGKGLLAQYIGLHNHVDLAISNASANAGHTFFNEGKKVILKHLPVSGIINKRSTIYLCAGAIIDPCILLGEIIDTNTDPNRVFIHPRAAVIDKTDIDIENTDQGVKRIASTMSGVGSALVRKINRGARLAGSIHELTRFIKDIDVQKLLDEGCTALMEVPQGMDLSLNHGFSYPYCTSRDITPSAALSDAGVHPKYIGKISVSLRTYPIRVGNIEEGGVQKGYSGPFYSDSMETTWEDIGVYVEYTTRTHRVRRVATFSHLQYKKMLQVMLPDYVFLNFCNYLKPTELSDLLETLPEVTHLGFSAFVEDILCR